MSLQKDTNQEGQRFVQHCLPFPSLCLSLSLSLSLCPYLYLSLSLSFYLSLYFLTPGIQPPQFEGGQVYAEASRVFQPQPHCRSQPMASIIGRGQVFSYSSSHSSSLPAETPDAAEQRNGNFSVEIPDPQNPGA